MSEAHLAEQFESIEKQEHAARFGFWIFLGSEVLLFSGLFVLYAAYRTMYPIDFADAVAHNAIYIGSVNTLILITSSFTVALTIWAVRAGKLGLIPWLLIATIALGLLFLALKLVEYRQHIRDGLLPGAHYLNQEMTSFGAQKFWVLYWVMTGLHALHVTAGLCALAWLTVRSFRGAYSAVSHVPLELGALYWHLVDVVWIFLWPLLYLVG